MHIHSNIPLYFDINILLLSFLPIWISKRGDEIYCIHLAKKTMCRTISYLHLSTILNALKSRELQQGFRLGLLKDAQGHCMPQAAAFVTATTDCSWHVAEGDSKETKIKHKQERP